MVSLIRKIQPSRIIVPIIAFLLGLIARFIFNPDPPAWRWLVFLLILLALAVLAYIWERLSPREVRVQFDSPVTVETESDQAQYARTGLVAFVSLFTSYKDREDKPSPDVIAAAIENTDYAALGFEDSNMEPIIHAAQSHKPRLKYCWLICTESTDRRPGSDVYAPLLEKCLKQTYGLDDCHFIYGPNTSVSLNDDLAVTSKTRDMLQQVFKSAEQLGLEPKDMVVDITGAVRSMTLGAVLACLDKTRDVEIIGAHYGEDGKPIPHDLTTIIAPFESIPVEK